MKLALVFPGQGAQYVGMAMELAQRYPIAREVLDQADDVLGFGLSDIIANGPKDELTRTDISQPAILVASWMAFQVLRDTARPLLFHATGGLSLGEYTALVAGEALSFEDALRLVRVRGLAMQEAAEAVPSGMVALIGADEAGATALCEAAADGDVLQVANLNATGQVVIAGAEAACQRAVDLARDHGIRRAMKLDVAGAFHSELMAPAADRLADALSQVAFQLPRIPVWSNVTGRPVTAASEIPDLLVRQLTSTVRWADCLQSIQADGGCSTFYELGPGKTICGMISRTLAGAVAANLDTPDDLPALLGG